MKIFKALAIVALVGCTPLFAAKSKLNRKQVDRILNNARTADFKTVEADIERLKKRGNKNAAKTVQAILESRKLAKQKQVEQQVTPVIQPVEAQTEATEAQTEATNVSEEGQQPSLNIDQSTQPTVETQPMRASIFVDDPALKTEMKRLEDEWDAATADGRQPTEEDVDRYLEGQQAVLAKQRIQF